MYTQRIVHFPALGKNAELRAALEERNTSGNAHAPHALSMLMFSPQPAFIHSIRFENLAAIEAYQERQQSDPTRAAQTSKITQNLSRPQAILLYEDLVAARTGTPKFLMRNRYSPAAGKGPELRALLQERVEKSRIPGLIGAGLGVQLASLDGPAFSVTLLFASMAGMDEYRAANAKDPTFRPFVNQVAALTRIPIQQRIHRILAPFPG